MDPNWGGDVGRASRRVTGSLFGDGNGDDELDVVALPVPSGVLDPGLYPASGRRCARASASDVPRAARTAAARATAALALPSPLPNALRAFAMLFPLSKKFVA